MILLLKPKLDKPLFTVGADGINWSLNILKGGLLTQLPDQ